jgi:alkanesulfonate monooxygenase SsuD/methylene tetrahydromethanopterin reductase-like flavin-dependent oxidoreductase (luciferase family)
VSQERFTFSGRLYRTDGARIEPKPDRRIPIWLRTYGNRALAVTEQLLGFRGLGFIALNFIPTGPDPAEQAERLAP